MTARWSLLLLGVLSGACTHSVHQLAVGGLDDIPRGARLRRVDAEVSQDVFLATGNTDYADRALAMLAERCPTGRVVGMEARSSTSLGFFSYTNRMKVSGYCVEEPELAR